MIRGLPVILALALTSCAQLSNIDPLTEACNGAAASLRTVTVAYKAGALTPTHVMVVDHSAAVIDGFCRPGAKRPTNLTDAIQAVTIAGANVAALHLN